MHYRQHSVYFHLLETTDLRKTHTVHSVIISDSRALNQSRGVYSALKGEHKEQKSRVLSNDIKQLLGSRLLLCVCVMYTFQETVALKCCYLYGRHGV